MSAEQTPFSYERDRIDKLYELTHDHDKTLSLIEKSLNDIQLVNLQILDDVKTIKDEILKINERHIIEDHDKKSRIQAIKLFLKNWRFWAFMGVSFSSAYQWLLAHGWLK